MPVCGNIPTAGECACPEHAAEQCILDASGYSLLFAATGADDSEAAKSVQRPASKGQSTLTSAQRATAVSSCTSASRRPRHLTVDMMSLCRPGVKVRLSQVSGEMSERDIELQQQEYISRLLDNKSSSRRHANATPRDNNPANQCSLWRTSQPMTTHHLVSHRSSKFTRS